MTYDAAELARLREEATGPLGLIKFPSITVLALIDALEKAIQENADWGEAVIGWTGPSATLALIAQRDSARALLRKSCPWVEAGTEFESTDAEARALLAEIAKELAQ